jgi:hypothetical protein
LSALLLLYLVSILSRQLFTLIATHSKRATAPGCATHMTAASSSSAPLDIPHLSRPEFALQIDSSGLPDHEAQHDSLGPRPGIVRHYSSLQEHADTLYKRPLTPSGIGESTPRAETRREGFTWEARRDADPASELPPVPETPPTLDEIMAAKAKDEMRDRVPSVASADIFPYPSLEVSKRVSTGLSFDNNVSRPNANRASISERARGVMRHVSDLRAFSTMNKEQNDDEDASIRRGNRESKSGRQLKFDLPQASAASRNEKASKPQNSFFEKPAPASPTKTTLKDRRKVAQGESMKLTLPSNIAELPSRGRSPVIELNSLAPPRSRSPKTPWIRDFPPNWNTSGPATAPATIFEDTTPNTPGLLPGHDLFTSSQTPPTDRPLARIRRSAPRLRLGRKKSSRKSTDSASQDGDSPSIPAPSAQNQSQMEHAQYVLQVHQADTNDQLQEVGKRSRTRRMRWSGPWSSTGSEPAPTPSLGGASFVLGVLKPMRSCQPDDPSSNETPNTPTTPTAETGRGFHRRKKAADMDKITKMPVPPTFIPPGVVRVPTPPEADERGQVKGKLADFFFNLEGVRAPTRKQPHTPGGIWNSDAVLMSQATDISPPSSDTDESPQAPLGITPPLSPVGGDMLDPAVAPTIAVTAPPIGGGSPLALAQAEPFTDTFRHEMFAAPSSLNPPRKDSIARAQERAKLEWLIPEHLPNSPLCPLHAKYVGPSKDACVFHGRRRSMGNGRPRRRETGGSRRSGALDGSGDFGWQEMWGFACVKRSARRKRVNSSGVSP